MGRWDYHCILLIEENKLDSFLTSLLRAREEIGNLPELKFSNLHDSGKYEKNDLAQKWIMYFLETQAYESSGIYFSVSGLDREKIDFSFFGEGDTPTGKYANLYNRFFRATVKGLVHHCYFGHKVTIKQIYHDCEGNLERHDYFEQGTLRKIAKETDDIDYENSEIVFVNSDHRKEQLYQNESHIIQFVDILIGAVTYCLHPIEKKKLGQRKLAERIFPYIQENINTAPRCQRLYPASKKSSISIFPRNLCYEHNDTIRQSEYYTPSCQEFEIYLDKQMGFQKLF